MKKIRKPIVSKYYFCDKFNLILFFIARVKDANQLKTGDNLIFHPTWLMHLICQMKIYRKFIVLEIYQNTSFVINSILFFIAERITDAERKPVEIEILSNKMAHQMRLSL